MRQMLLGALDDATANKRLLRNKSHLGTSMPSHLMDHLQTGLLPYRFFLHPERNQLQLWSRTFFGVPICLRWCKGYYADGIVSLSAAKGEVTRIGTSQNHEHFYSQGKLFEEDHSVYAEVFNITLVWDLVEKRAQGWLVKAIELPDDGTQLLCDDHWVICDEQHDPTPKPRIDDQPDDKPSIGGDADYDLPFSERIAS
jgi:hypothetical protein